MATIDYSTFQDTLETSIDGIEPGSLTPDKPLAEVPQWDSLARLTVIALADAEYGVNLTASDLNACITVGDIHVCIQQRA